MLLYRRKNEEYGIFRYAVLFSEIEEKLKKLSEKYKENMTYETIGHSNEKREIFLVTLAKDVSRLSEFSSERQKVLQYPDEALSSFREKRNLPLPVAINCNLHGTEISGTDGMFTFIEEVLGGKEKERYLSDAVILISICMNPDGRSRGLDILNGNGVDLNRDWMAQTQPETRALISGCLKRYYPVILVDMHGYMSSGNILIDACTPPHNPFSEYDLLTKHLVNNSRAMALEIKKRTGLDSDIASDIYVDGWDDYSPVYTTGYFMLNGAITHTIELNFPSEEGAYAAHCASIGMLDYVHAHKDELYENQCTFYKRGVENQKDNEFHADYYIIKANKIPLVRKTVEQLIFNNISVFLNENGDYVVPLAQPLRPLIHNMLWVGEDISEKTENCYDVSFYSYTVMRGLDVIKANKGDKKTQNLSAVSKTDEYFPKNKVAKPKQKNIRILAVTESGMTAEVLLDAGYDVKFLPFSELNTGWQIDTTSYDILIAGGSKTLFWEDAFDDMLGIGYQNSWALRERGRNELIRAAEKSDKLILFGYAGMQMNERLKRVTAEILMPAEAEVDACDKETGKYMFNVSNGSFKMQLASKSPICKGFDENEIFYMAAPVAWRNADADIFLRFAKNSFINGFNKNKDALDEHIAAFHKTDENHKTVIFGFDPVFRGYTDKTFDLLINAVEILNKST